MQTPSLAVTKPAFIGTQTVSTRIYNYGYYPLIKGDFAPVSHLSQEPFISMQHYLDLQQPLVLFFFPAAGNIASLNALASLQLEVQENGGNLVVLTSNTSRSFRKQVSQLNNLTVYEDRDNEVAELFGLFDEANPLGNWLSGIEDANAALPAVYVIAPDREIVFHHIDYQFNAFIGNEFPDIILTGLLDAVSTLSTSYSYLSRWRKKLVS
ncbi:redoxin domain-containing protein [Parasediminibacterium sp. JCM 36343]|uniref:redoxin domain-containing protein n=1 Tax=Parasediminibacterium sp. JCM 36343 TaxID=3374279 RepID=UPI00397A7292